MSADTSDVLAAIDGALRDPGVSGDAMRWTPGPPAAPPASKPAPSSGLPPALPRVMKVTVRAEYSDGSVREMEAEQPLTVDWAIDWPPPPYLPWELDSPCLIPHRGDPTLTVTVRPSPDHPAQIRDIR